MQVGTMVVIFPLTNRKNTEERTSHFSSNGASSKVGLGNFTQTKSQKLWRQ